MYKNKIKELIKTLNKTANECDKQFITRHNKNKNKQIFFRDIILFSANLINSSGYAVTNSNFKINYDKSFSFQAFHKKRYNMNPDLIDKLNDSQIDFEYKNNKKVRYIGTDGSQINLDYKKKQINY